MARAQEALRSGGGGSGKTIEVDTLVKAVKADLLAAERLRALRQ